MADRINFGKLDEVISPPNFIENQINSFKELLANDIGVGSGQNVGV
jgi:DNA-directed RNA polymerase subunit beta